MTRHRHKRDRQVAMSQSGVQDGQQFTEAGITDQECAEDHESASVECRALGFYDVEQRACERFEEATRMIDERLKI